MFSWLRSVPLLSSEIVNAQTNVVIIKQVAWMGLVPNLRILMFTSRTFLGWSTELIPCFRATIPKFIRWSLVKVPIIHSNQARMQVNFIACLLMTCQTFAQKHVCKQLGLITRSKSNSREHSSNITGARSEQIVTSAVKTRFDPEPTEPAHAFSRESDGWADYPRRCSRFVLICLLLNAWCERGLFSRHSEMLMVSLLAWPISRILVPFVRQSLRRLWTTQIASGKGLRHGAENFNLHGLFTPPECPSGSKSNDDSVLKGKKRQKNWLSRTFL